MKRGTGVQTVGLGGGARGSHGVGVGEDVGRGAVTAVKAVELPVAYSTPLIG